MRSVTSIKDRLKNYAQASGRTVQDIYTVYILERVLYRLSISDYVDNFTLKGGILLHGLYTDDFSRSTTDIDLLGRNISNDKERIKTVFTSILSVEADDPICFDLDSLDVDNIAEFKEYHGIRVTTKAYLDRTCIVVGIDIGFGDIIYPERVKMDYPTLLDDDSPSIYAYSIYSIIAEKAEAIVSLGIANSRYKDFYDLCTIPDREDLDGTTLKEALLETFNQRHSDFNRIAAFEEGFTEDYSRQQRWKGFLKTKRVVESCTFEFAVNKVKAFLLPVFESMQSNSSFNAKWDHVLRKWKDVEE